MCMKRTKPGSSNMFYLNLIFTRDRLYASVLRHILGQFKCAGALEIMRRPPPLGALVPIRRNFSFINKKGRVKIISVI
jgi:hypothetical protein